MSDEPNPKNCLDCVHCDFHQWYAYDSGEGNSHLSCAKGHWDEHYGRADLGEGRQSDKQDIAREHGEFAATVALAETCPDFEPEEEDTGVC